MPVSKQIPRPQLGDRVLYRLSADDAWEVNNRRTRSASAPKSGWGFQAHRGNTATGGTVAPATVVAVADGYEANLQVHLDGTDVLWRTGVDRGVRGGQWDWPV